MKKTPATDLAESLGILDKPTAGTIANVILGKTYEEAKTIMESYECVSSYRILQRDGEHYMATQDMRPDRLNLHIEKGVITKAYRG